MIPDLPDPLPGAPGRAPMELLAPAGDRACLEAALAAGADAVYLGLATLNARRNARNFSEAELARACELAHGRGRRVHLALNVDLAHDDLRRAARMLELAAALRVDAVLVRDPALFALLRAYPELEVHLSTQACVASVADVEAARALGARRVVLARELSLDEVARASAVDGVETEVFALGALCISVSGRCLLSSWAGGRSGNRGQCTSPCRVPWTLDGRPGGTPLSPRDLSLVARVEALRAAGVRSLKVEGRMKNPAWVRAAVSLLRRAIDGNLAPAGPGREAPRPPGAGRTVTSGYLDGRRDDLLEPSLPAAGGPPRAADPPPAASVLRPSAAALLAEADVVARAGPARAPDRVRLDAGRAAAFLAAVRPAGGAIVEGLDADGLARLVEGAGGLPIAAALPAVLFDDERAGVERLVRAAAALGVPVEANTWGGWHLARAAGARVRGGPGLGILNALAARELVRLGLEEATASVEADASKLEALAARSVLPLSVVVFGRPALVTTRAGLPAAVAGAELEDGRAVRLRARRAGSCLELRPVLPFDLRGARLPPSVAHLVVDLVGSPDPLAEWAGGPEGAGRFNHDRALG